MNKGGKMKEELKEQIEALHEDPAFMDILESMKDMEGDESYFAEMYIQQESPFGEFEPKN